MEEVVGKRERVGGGIFRIGVKVLEEIRYVNVYALPRHSAADVMQPGIRNMRIFEALKELVVPAKERRLSNAVHRLDLSHSPREIRRDCDPRNAARKPTPFFRAALAGADQGMKRSFRRPRLARRDDESAAVRRTDGREENVGVRASALVPPEVDRFDEWRIREHSEMAAAVAFQPRRRAMRQRHQRRPRPLRRLHHVRERRIRQEQDRIDRKRRFARIGHTLDFCDEVAAFRRDANLKVEHGNARVAL